LTKDDIADAEDGCDLDIATNKLVVCNHWLAGMCANLNNSEQFNRYLPAYPFYDFAKSLDDPKKRLPAFVGTVGRTGKLEFTIDFIWDDQNDEQLRQALSGSWPWRWPTGNGEILFDCRLWTLSAVEQCYTEDELRLVFLDAVDQERRKFEKLKARFDRLSRQPEVPGQHAGQSEAFGG
jgi:hypothetical protein